MILLLGFVNQLRQLLFLTTIGECGFPRRVDAPSRDRPKWHFPPWPVTKLRPIQIPKYLLVSGAHVKAKATVLFAKATAFLAEALAKQEGNGPIDLRRKKGP